MTWSEVVKSTHTDQNRKRTHTHTQIYTRIILTVLKLRLSSCLIKHRAINACDGVYAPRIPNRGSRFWAVSFMSGSLYPLPPALNRTMGGRPGQYGCWVHRKVSCPHTPQFFGGPSCSLVSISSPLSSRQTFLFNCTGYVCCVEQENVLPNWTYYLLSGPRIEP